jgi:two-component sensor histidine kinase
LLHSIVESQGDAGNRVILRSEIVAVDVDIETAIPLGLIVNELVTNAYKHAFPGGRRGSISVSLQAPDGGPLELAVVDDGIGMPADFDLGRTDSLGLRLVRSLAEQLGASLVSPAPGDRASRFAIRFTPEMREHSRLHGAGEALRSDRFPSTNTA